MTIKGCGCLQRDMRNYFKISDLEETIRTQQSTIDRLTEYEEAVHAHFDVACHSYDSSKSVYDNLTMLQAWHGAVALDPKVSKEAAELHDKIDRLTEQINRMLAMLKDEQEHVYDSTCPYCGGRDYHHDKHASGCHHSRRLALIAEIEAGK